MSACKHAEERGSGAWWWCPVRGTQITPRSSCGDQCKHFDSDDGTEGEMGARKLIGWTRPAGETINGGPMDVTLEVWAANAVASGAGGGTIMRAIGVSPGTFYARMKKVREMLDMADVARALHPADQDDAREPAPVEPRPQAVSQVSGAQAPSALAGAAADDDAAPVDGPRGEMETAMMICPRCTRAGSMVWGRVLGTTEYYAWHCSKCAWRSRLVVNLEGAADREMLAIEAAVSDGWDGDHTGLLAPHGDAAPVDIELDDAAAGRLADDVLGGVETVLTYEGLLRLREHDQTGLRDELDCALAFIRGLEYHQRDEYITHRSGYVAALGDVRRRGVV